MYIIKEENSLHYVLLSTLFYVEVFSTTSYFVGMLVIIAEIIAKASLVAKGRRRREVEKDIRE